MSDGRYHWEDPDPPRSPLTGLSLRMPPANIQAEQALLGAVLANNAAYERVSDFLLPEHFAEPIHGEVYRAISRRIESGQLADAVTLRVEFEANGVLDQVGGTEFLAGLLVAMVGIINAGEYGRAVYDAWMRRQLIEIGERVVNNAFGADPELDAPHQVEAAEQSLFTLAQGNAGRGFVTFEQALTEAVGDMGRAFASHGQVSGIATGLSDIDRKLGGLQPADLLVLAGRPGMGKTALAMKMAYGAAKSMVGEKACVGVFSLEMTSGQIATRLLAEEARVSSDRLRRGDIGLPEIERLVVVSRQIASLPIEIDDTPGITLSALRTRCRRLKRTRGLALVVVDYLQLMRSAGGRNENRTIEIGQFTQGLKGIAKELSIPIVLLSQLSRAVENREDKRPQMSDLRDSGSIEQDADVVMFLYRDEYYLEQKMPAMSGFDNQDKFQTALSDWRRKLELAHHKAELVFSKHRHGPTGMVPLYFEPEFTRFDTLDRTVMDDDAG
jgi:replicative DNA helicase